MKVVLKENIPGVGQKNEIKEVTDGYARNYLFPKKLATKAIESEVKKAKQIQNKKEEKKSKRRKELKKLAEEITEKKIKFEMKVGEKGQLFESIDKKDIVKKIKELGYEEVKEKHINLEKPIENEGEYEINLNLGEDLKSTLKVLIKEKENE